MEQRAITEPDKQRKYQLILAAALRLFTQERRLQTAATIAKEAKIAKGTLYLYFSTKEEIYMELLIQNFRRWHEGLRNYLLDHQPNKQEMIEFMCRSLADFTLFVDLVSFSSMVLEENLSLDYVRKARTQLRQESIRSSQLIARSFPPWTEAFCLQSLQRFYTYSIGFWKDCFPSAQVVKAMPEEFGDESKQRERYFKEIYAMNAIIWEQQ
ncbi:MAG: TetR family transcriptional regulator [Oligoflexus sp.]